LSFINVAPRVDSPRKYYPYQGLVKRLKGVASWVWQVYERHLF